jgi:hypothetical protein
VLSAGQFEFGGDQSLMPGKYLVAIQTIKSTGKTFNHPQKGHVPLREAMTVADSLKEVDVTQDNASELSLEYHTK